MKLERRLNRNKIFISVIFEDGEDLMIVFDQNGRSAKFECKSNKRIVEVNSVIGRICEVSKVSRGSFVANSGQDISDKVVDEIVENFYEVDFITGSIPVTYMFPKKQTLRFK